MKILDKIDNKEPIIISGDGSEAFDFVSVKDCAEANICDEIRCKKSILQCWNRN